MALANVYGFNELLVTNYVTIETTTGYASKLNKIIERPNRDFYLKIRITMGMMKALHIEVWWLCRKIRLSLNGGLSTQAFNPRHYSNDTVTRLIAITRGFLNSWI